MILACNFGLYKTADNALNSFDKEQEPVHFLDLQPWQVINDFVGDVITRIGVPVSRRYLEVAALAKKISFFPNAEGQMSDNDQTLLNLNEWTEEALVAFLRTPRAANYEFFGVMSTAPSKANREYVDKVREWAAKKKDTTGTVPLCDMLLWKEWRANDVDGWLFELTNEADIKIAVPEDHPALAMPAIFNGGTIIFYAIDMKARGAAEENARKHPFLLTFNKPRQRAITNGPPLIAASTSSTASTAASTTSAQVTVTSHVEKLELAMPSKLVTQVDEYNTSKLSSVEKRKREDGEQSGSGGGDDDDDDDDNAVVSTPKRAKDE